ncbi:MAG: protein kinase [Myxococcota bacterium]
MGDIDEREIESRMRDMRTPPDIVARRRLLERVEAGLFTRPQAPAEPVLKSRYRLTELLGAGGMGIVYGAHDPELDRRVAIKLVQARSSVDRDVARDLLREARVLARLAHPHVVPVYDIGSYAPRDLEGLGVPRTDDEGEHLFVVMEWVKGATLDRWLDEAVRPRKRILEVFAQAGAGLAAAHAVGVVHRDFKPRNVIVGRDGRPRVLDFGLARREGDPTSGVCGVEPEEETRQVFDPMQTLVRTGMALGTPAYMAPEQHRGGHGDARSDQYSFCLALYEALTGVRPFGGDSIPNIAREKLRGRVEFPATARIPRRLRRVLRRGLRPDPSERYPSMDPLLEELRALSHPRRSWAIAGGVSFLVGTGLTAMVAGDPGADCEADARTQIAGVWNDEVRVRLGRAFSIDPAPYAQASWATVEDEIDAFAERWVDSETRVCRGEDAGPLKAARATCLDDQRERLTALIDVFGSGRHEVVGSAVALLEDLPRVADCGSVTQQRPPSTRLRPTTLALARARALDDAGETTAARAVLLEEVAKHGDARSSSTASLHLLLARMDLRRGDLNGAEAQAYAAWTTAELGGDSRRVNRAVLVLAATRRARGRYADATDLISVVNARSTHEPPASALRARVLTETGELAWARGEFETADATLAEAAQAWVEARGARASGYRMAVSTRALVLAKLGRTEDATAMLRDLIVQLRAQHGEGHPVLAETKLDLASVLRAAQQPMAALEQVREAVALADRAGYEGRLGRADALEVAATLELALGRAVAAEGLAARLVDEQQAALGEGHLQLVDAHSTVALARMNRGRPLAALEALEDAQHANETAPEPSPLVDGMLSALQCDVWMQLGDADRALERCRVSLHAWQSVAPDNPTTALIQLVHANAQADAGNVERARSEADHAHALLVRAEAPAVMRGQAAVLQGELWMSAGALGEAARRFEEARWLLRADPSSSPAEWVRVSLRLATLAALNGDRGRAIEYARTAVDFAKVQGLEVDVAAASSDMLAALLRDVDPIEARRHRGEAAATWELLAAEDDAVTEFRRWSRRARRAVR